MVRMEHKVQANNHHPVISVIIPVYNVADYLDRCIKSVVENDYRELQIICVNDGSTDQCGEILRVWKEKDERIEVVEQENKGVSDARNTGIRCATGEYICFIDSDDWIHRQYFSILLNGIISAHADISTCGFIRTRDEQTRSALDPNNIHWRSLARDEYLTLHNVCKNMYKRELISPAFDPMMLRFEDTAFNTLLFYQNPNVKVVSAATTLYYYYYRSGSLNNTADGAELKLLFDFFIQFAERSMADSDQAGQYVFILQCVKAALSYRYSSMFLPSRKKEAQQYCQRAKNFWFHPG